MKKTPFLLLAVFLFSCATTAGKITKESSPYTAPEGDADAAYIQPLMDSSVKIEETVKVKFTPNSLGLELGLEEGVDNFQVSGSGVVVESSSTANKSLVFTAWHVCDTYKIGHKAEDILGTYEVIESNQQVVTPAEEKIDIYKKAYLDKNTDTCVIIVKEYLPNHVDLADKMPPRGAFVDVVGAPEGNWGKYVVSSQRGRYQGLMNINVWLGNGDTKATSLKEFAYYGFAGVGGFSGSGIFYKGKLIGLHTAGSTRFEHSSFGPTVHQLKQAYKKVPHLN